MRVLRLVGPFTLNTLVAFQETVRKDPGPLTIIDLSDVPYMDSAALGSLLGVHVSCERNGRKYALVGVPERIETLFRTCHVDDFLVIHPDLAAAELSLLGESADGTN